MKTDDIQRIILRSPSGPVVAHLILTVPEPVVRRQQEELDVLRQLIPSFGTQASPEPGVSVGISFAGLEALGMNEGYLRVLRRLAPAFADGAVLRSHRLGDTGASAATWWGKEFQTQRAHVLVSWHGSLDVLERAERFAQSWQQAFVADSAAPDPLVLTALLDGKRLGAPAGKEGEWVHYGYRDGISEIFIDDALPRPFAADLRSCPPGDLVLGEINSAGVNSFALSQAPDKVRQFFGGSSFGILRPMVQNVWAFERQIEDWKDQLSAAYGGAVPREFVKAKLCGRWPDGRQMMPGDIHTPTGTLQLRLGKDDEGYGCPFGSHVRRMRAAPDGDGHVFDRPLQRRSIPFGPAAWDGGLENDGQKRGLHGHFFCGSIESQFEHLLGQWAARSPLGFAVDDNAPDPVIGMHADDAATLVVPWKDRLTQRLSGFQSWTQTLGTMYAWYPGRQGWHDLLRRDFVPDRHRAPWL